MWQSVILNANVVSSDQTFLCDITISNGKVQSLRAVGSFLQSAGRVIDAKGAYVTPGGVDAHVHLSQDLTKGGLSLPFWFADDFTSGSRSAVAGGTTTVIAFAMQYKSQKQQTLEDVIEEYHEIVNGKSYSDYAFHVIITDPRPAILEEIPELIPKHGISSIKLFMTYDSMRVDDLGLLSILFIAKRHGIVPLIHAENADMITFLTDKLQQSELITPIYHASSRPAIVETEAANRALAMAELLDTPVLLVHVSAPDTVALLRKAQTGTSHHNATVYAETCPQYLVLTEAGLDQPGFEGARCVCSPPLRKDDNGQTLEKMWRGLNDGTLTIVSSDHAPTHFEGAKGKQIALSPSAEHGNFKLIPNGLPGVETRLPLLFSQGVLQNRISIEKFVEVTATNPAKLYGLYPKKGVIQPGSDADLVIWWPETEAPRFQLKNERLHHDCDYTPYEGMQFNNWPKYTMLRGNISWSWEDAQATGEVTSNLGDGQFVRRGPSHWNQNRYQRHAAVPAGQIGNNKVGADWRP